MRRRVLGGPVQSINSRNGPSSCGYTPTALTRQPRLSRSENQLQELRRYTDARGWTTVEYVDKGVSGAKDRRPALDCLFTDARRGVLRAAGYDEQGKTLFIWQGVTYLPWTADVCLIS